jgi:hypothetical protein
MEVNEHYEGIELMLCLYDLRREPQLRKARNWYLENFYPTSIEEIEQKYPHRSDEGTYIEMVLTFWDMVAGLLNRGLMDQALFFENNGEMWVTWDRIRHIVPAWRSCHKNPALFRNMQDACKRSEEAREKNAPNSTVILRRMIWAQKNLIKEMPGDG